MRRAVASVLVALGSLLPSFATPGTAEDDIGQRAMIGDVDRPTTTLVAGFPELARAAPEKFPELARAEPHTPEGESALAQPEPEAGPDWIGLSRDTAFLIGYQIVGAGIIYVLPDEVSNWSDDDKSRADRWLENVQNPTWDDDSWYVNYIGHPYFGATYYIRARERGFDGFSSFLYSAFASAAYEFGVEAFFEEPSIQDLIVTPIGGALVGKFIFEPVRSKIRGLPELEWYHHVGLFLTDPIGALNGMFERMLGIESNVRMDVKPTKSANRGHGVTVELSLDW
jgi:hypothetical protein